MSWRDLITHNFGWKLLSLALAVLIWTALSRGRIGPQTRRELRGLPITVMTEASDNHAFRVTPDVVNLRVMGKRDLVENLQPAGLEVYVNLTGLDADSNMQRRIQVYVPPGLSVLQVDPPYVRVRVIPLDFPPTAPTPSSAKTPQ